jgi:hypothetical protein
MASTLFGGCSVEAGSTSIDASAVSRLLGSTGASGAIASKTGQGRRSTMFTLTELMHFGPSPVVSMTLPGLSLRGVIVRRRQGSDHTGVTKQAQTAG